VGGEFGDGGGGGRGSRGGGGSGSGLRDLTEPVVDPGLEDTVDGGIDHFTTLLDIGGGGLSGSGSSRSLLEVQLRVSMAALMTVKASNGRPSGQGRCQNGSVLEVHFWKGKCAVLKIERMTRAETLWKKMNCKRVCGKRERGGKEGQRWGQEWV